MDEDTLDYVLESCTDEEMEIISDAMEASDISDKDRDDIQFISSIQEKARRSGWGAVPREDRDKFVNIMGHSKNIKVLKKAAKLGEKEAVHDDKVLHALKSIRIGGAVGGGVGGAIAANRYDKNVNKDINAMFDQASNEINANGADAIKQLRGNNRLQEYLNSGAINEIKQGKADALLELEKYRAKSLIPHEQIIGDTALGGGLGAAGGALLSAGASAIAKGVHNAKINNRDKRQLAMQGEMKTPTERWKAIRRAESRNK